ncbi:MAG: hypothetical protein Q3976_07745 [Corynebacterium sp.]|nr:hypothetical protein [Corynebacterium sp.]
MRLLPIAVLALPLALAACGGDEEIPETSTPAVATNSEVTSESSSTPDTDFADEDIQAAYEQFGSLVPKSLFEDFDSCNANGVDNSMACSGPKVGQFQFFDSDAKASSTTQLLTQLRGAKVVADEGDRIVGWSTLGSTAIITVVAPNEGLVLQQMVDTDDVDPTERIYELELATPAEDATSTAKSSSESSSTSASNTTTQDTQDEDED